MEFLRKNLKANRLAPVRPIANSWKLMHTTMGSSGTTMSTLGYARFLIGERGWLTVTPANLPATRLLFTEYAEQLGVDLS